MNRCSWVNLKNEEYVKYHDLEWGVLNTTDEYLLEMLLLEGFQAGLSWECILNKRKYFSIAYDNFKLESILKFDEEKIEELLNNDKLIKNKLKIKASINNAKVFKSIIEEYKSFYAYLKTFTHGKVYYERGKTTSKLSDSISKDLKKRGMKFMGSITVYAYLQAIGIINSHELTCFKFVK